IPGERQLDERPRWSAFQISADVIARAHDEIHRGLFHVRLFPPDSDSPASLIIPAVAPGHGIPGIRCEMVERLESVDRRIIGCGAIERPPHSVAPVRLEDLRVTPGAFP